MPNDAMGTLKRWPGCDFRLDTNTGSKLYWLEAWMAAQSGWKVELMALGLALVIVGCFLELGRWLLNRL